MTLNDEALMRAIEIYLDKEGRYDILSSPHQLEEYTVHEDISSITFAVKHQDIEEGWWSYSSGIHYSAYEKELKYLRSKKIDKLLKSL